MSCPTLPLLLLMITIPGLKGTVFTTFCSIGAGHHKSMKFYLIIKSFLNIFYLANTFSRTVERHWGEEIFVIAPNAVELPAMNGLRIYLLPVGLYIEGRWKKCGIWIKKSFSFFTLTPSQSGWKPLFIGVSGVRVRVRVWGQKWGKGRSIDNTTKKETVSCNKTMGSRTGWCYEKSILQKCATKSKDFQWFILSSE